MDSTDQIDATVQDQVDEALRTVEARVAADGDLVHGDVVEQVALGLPVEVATVLCRQSMGFVPDTVRARVFEAENADAFARSAALSAERDAAEQKAAQRSKKAAATRAQTLAAESAAAREKMRSATCPECFTVRSPSGICACD